jgi:hypothetical protein
MADELDTALEQFDEIVREREAADDVSKAEPEPEPSFDVEKAHLAQRRIKKEEGLRVDDLRWQELEELGGDEDAIRAELIEREEQASVDETTESWREKAIHISEALEDHGAEALSDALEVLDDYASEASVWDAATQLKETAPGKVDAFLSAWADEQPEAVTAWATAHDWRARADTAPTIEDLMQGVAGAERIEAEQTRQEEIADAISTLIDEARSDPKGSEEVIQRGAEMYLTAISRNPALAPSTADEAREGLSRAIRHAHQQSLEERQPDEHGRSTVDMFARQLAVLEKKGHEQAWLSGDTDEEPGRVDFEERVERAKADLIDPDAAAARASRDPDFDPLLASLDEAIERRSVRDPDWELAEERRAKQRQVEHEQRRRRGLW